MSDLGSISGLPHWHPPLDVLELAELVLSGVLGAPAGAIVVPAEFAGSEPTSTERIVLEDAEGTPVAVLQIPAEGAAATFERLRPFSHGPLRAARRLPIQVKAELAAAGAGTAGVIAVPVTSILSTKAVEAVLAEAAESGRSVLWLAVVGAGRPRALPAAGLWRAVRGLAEDVAGTGIGSVAVAVAVPALEIDSLLPSVAEAYGAGELFDPEPLNSPIEAIELLHPRFAAERARAVPPPDRRGVTIFFSGLSGSGKSTVAKALADRLAERSLRTVSLLDGDEVRRLLSAGLGFSRADRDLNIRRIGFVATEVSRHGGIAICAPIAPFAGARAQVRAAVEEVGDFVLIHISTPLAECERRDRKGLYAKARQGLIPDFTGISSPYEVPVDADLRLDTSRLPVTDAVDAIWELLSERNYLPAAH